MNTQQTAATLTAAVNSGKKTYVAVLAARNGKTPPRAGFGHVTTAEELAILLNAVPAFGYRLARLTPQQYATEHAGLVGPLQFTTAGKLMVPFARAASVQTLISLFDSHPTQEINVKKPSRRAVTEATIQNAGGKGGKRALAADLPTVIATGGKGGKRAVSPAAEPAAGTEQYTYQTLDKKKHPVIRFDAAENLFVKLNGKTIKVPRAHYSWRSGTTLCKELPADVGALSDAIATAGNRRREEKNAAKVAIGLPAWALTDTQTGKPYRFIAKDGTEMFVVERVKDGVIKVKAPGRPGKSRAVSPDAYKIGGRGGLQYTEIA